MYLSKRFKKKRFFNYQKLFISKIILLIISLFCEISYSGSNKKTFQLLIDFRRCLSKEGKEGCEELILSLEKMQVEEYKKENFRCQTALLGMQTEVIKNMYFSKNDSNSKKNTIKYVIKNC